MSYTPTETDIKQLRLITGEYPAETSAYTDEDLTALATEYGYSDLESFYRDYGATEETAKTFLMQDKIVEFLTGKLN